MLGALDHLHRRLVAGGRRAALTRELTRLVEGTETRTLLDLGCGDGQLGVALAQALGARLTSMDATRTTAVGCPVELYDGRVIPRASDTFDLCLLADVLHHATSPRALLQEALRVAPLVLVKDHMSFGPHSDWTLTLMDLAGNPLEGARAQYLSPAGWLALFDSVSVTRELVWPLRVHAPAVSFFTRDEHQFAALLVRPSA